MDIVVENWISTQFQILDEASEKGMNLPLILQVIGKY